ncbi:MAG: DnaJ domain-containing protein [Blastocatellia bacterium]
MPDDFPRQGQLAALPFTELARRIHQRQLSGTLTLAQGAVKKIIQFTQGDVCGTASNQSQDSILSVLVSNGHLSQAQAGEIRQQVAAGRKLSQVLLENSQLSREMLTSAQFDQVTIIFTSLCAWQEGSYSFEEGSPVENSSRLRVPDLLLGVARQVSSPEILDQLRGDGTARVQLAPGAMERCAQFRLKPQEGYLMTRLDVPLTIAELLMVSGLAEIETLRSLYTLECAELIVISGRTAVASAAAAAFTSRPVTPPPQPAAAETTAAPAPPAKAANAEEASLDEIMQMARLVAESDDDALILGLTASATRAEVKNAYTRLAKKYHPDRYQKSADEATLVALKDIFARIRKAYEAMRTSAPEAAPEAAPPVQPQKEAVEEPVVETFNHGTAAPAFNVRPVIFETNSTDSSEPAAPTVSAPPAFENFAATKPVTDSAPPVAEMTSEPPTQPSVTEAVTDEAPPEAVAEGAEASRPATGDLNCQGAELNFQHAIARYQSGDLVGALELMNTAVELAPDNAFYHDQLATLLAINPRRRKDAETHLLRAIELEPENPAWLIHLGLLYKTLNFTARAEVQFKKALSLDPQNQQARHELRAVAALKNQPQAAADKASAPESPARKNEPAKTQERSVSDLLAKAKETSVSDLFSKLFKRK